MANNELGMAIVNEILDIYQEQIRMHLVQCGTSHPVVSQVCKGVEERIRYFKSTAEEIVDNGEGDMNERLLQYYARINGWLHTELFGCELKLATLEALNDRG